MASRLSRRGCAPACAGGGDGFRLGRRHRERRPNRLRVPRWPGRLRRLARRSADVALRRDAHAGGAGGVRLAPREPLLPLARVRGQRWAVASRPGPLSPVPCLRACGVDGQAWASLAPVGPRLAPGPLRERARRWRMLLVFCDAGLSRACSLPKPGPRRRKQARSWLSFAGGAWPFVLASGLSRCPARLHPTRLAQLRRLPGAGAAGLKQA